MTQNREPLHREKKESPGEDKLGFKGPWLCVSLPHGTEQEPEADFSGTAKESPPAPQCAPPSLGQGSTHRSSRQSLSLHGTCTYDTPQRARSVPPQTQQGLTRHCPFPPAPTGPAGLIPMG